MNNNKQPVEGIENDPLYRPNHTIASAPRRLSARLIDGFILFVIFLIPLVYVFSSEFSSYEESLGLMELIEILLYTILILLTTTIIWTSYEFYAIRKSGATIGKKLMGIKVISLDNQKITRGQAFKRTWLYILTTIIVAFASTLNTATIPNPVGGIISILISAAFSGALISLALWRKDGRHIFDLAASTMVISVRDSQKEIKTSARKALAVIYLLFVLVGNTFSNSLSKDNNTTIADVRGQANNALIENYAAAIYKDAYAAAMFEGKNDVTDAEIDLKGNEQTYGKYDEKTNKFEIENNGETYHLHICVSGVQKDPCVG